MKKLSLAYFGSPDFSANFLEKIILDKNLSVEIKFVVTQPDHPAGRKQILTPTALKIMAKKYGLEIVSSESIKNLDLALVYAYGELIPKQLLNLPKFGFWNAHPSLLPKYRGPSPMASALINGDKTTGVTIIKMDEEIDHGPIMAQESLPIEKTDKRPDLEKRLTDLAFQMFKKLVSEDNLKPALIPQNDELTVYTKKLEKSDGFIDFAVLKKAFEGVGGEKIYNLFRGLYPWPGIWTTLPNKKRLKITDLEIKDGRLSIKRVQLEGKNEVDFKTFNEAYKIFLKN
jgi:methionyl-tRNA formyltransferase